MDKKKSVSKATEYYDSEMMQLLLYMLKKRAVEIFKADMCFIMLLIEDEFVVEGVEGTDYEDIYVGKKVIAGKDLLGKIAYLKKPSIISDIKEFAKDFSISDEIILPRSLMASPLWFGGEMLGVISVCRNKETGFYVDNDIEQYTNFAEQIAVSIGSQRLVDIRTAELKRTRNKLMDVNNKLRKGMEKEKKAHKTIVNQLSIIEKQHNGLLAKNHEIDKINEELLEKSLITERSEKEFRNLVEHVNEGIVIVQNDVIKYANPCFVNAVGGDLESLIDKNFFDFFDDKTVDQLNLDFQEILGNDRQSKNIYELSMNNKNGKRVNIEVSCNVTTFEEDIAFLVYIHNTTERYELQEKLAKAQKLESIGQLAAGIAHEINTPTQYVSDNVHFFKDSIEDLESIIVKYKELVESIEKKNIFSEDVKKIKEFEEEIDLDYLLKDIPDAIDQSLEGLSRVAKIVRSMKEFSHPSEGSMTLVDLNKAIETTTTIARNEYKYVADLELKLDSSLPSVYCDPNEINQVVLNILVNAAHAIEDFIGDRSGEKGKITIQTAKVGEVVEIRISDTGSGIPEEIREKIFDPFFTTKEVGKGTGQGLAISRSIIEDKHNGHIEIDSEVGKGAVFVIKLPVEGKPVKVEEK
ncbi:PAS domain S-box protein [bacterium]|nr:PAS domain S-box protein [bacterium]